MAALAAAILCAGCAEELHPVAMPTTRVQGVVTDGARPVSGGWIEFIPVEGTIGVLRSARLGADGTFDTDGVAVGINAIRLFNTRIASRPYRGLFSTFSSPIRRKIGGGESGATSGPSRISVNLVQESIKFQKSQSRSLPGEPSTAGEAP